MSSNPNTQSDNSRTKHPRLLPIIIAAIIGGSLIWCAFLINSPPAAVNVLSGAGVAIFLFLPLYWIQERSYRIVQRVEVQQQTTTSTVQDLSHAVENVQEQVRATNLRIDELGPATLKLISEQRDENDAAISRFLEAPTWRSTQAMFDMARRLNAVGASIACRIGTSQRWLFFMTGTLPAVSHRLQPTLGVSLDFSEPDDGNQRSVYWSPNDDAHVFMVKVADGLKRLQKYPGDNQFDASTIFKTLGNTVRSTINYRHEGRDIGPLFAIVNPEWALTERGLESLYETHTIPRKVIENSECVESPPWIGNNTTPERDLRYQDALELARNFFR